MMIPLSLMRSACRAQIACRGTQRDGALIIGRRPIQPFACVLVEPHHFAEVVQSRDLDAGAKQQPVVLVHIVVKTETLTLRVVEPDNVSGLIQIASKARR